MQQRYQCPNCGSQVAFGVRFCGNCGTQLNWPTQQQQPPQYQPPPQYQQQYQRPQYQQPQQQWSGYQQQPELPKKKKTNVWLMGCLGLIVLAAMIGGIALAIGTSLSETSPSISPPAFSVSRSTLFNLLATPTNIEPTLADSEQYSVSGWQRNDLSDGTPRWMAQAREIYAYELIGEPAYKLTLLAGMTGQVEDSADLMVRAVLLVRATGVPKEEAGVVLLELMDKSLDDPDKSYRNMAGDSIITVTFYEILSSMLISVEALK